MRKIALTLVLGVLGMGSVAQAKPLPLNPDFIPATPKTHANKTDFNFSGIAALPGCSASIVTFGQPDTAKAVLMTNAHCVRGMMDGDPRTVLSNLPYTTSAKLYQTIDTSIRANVTKIIYALIQPHDIALMELDQTYAELKAAGIKARALRPTIAPVGEHLVFASGYFDEVSTCDVEGIIYRLKEGDWVNENVIKYTKCDSKHGTSGTPLISADSDDIVGINMTGNDDGEECTVDNPCEIAEDGTITVVKGAGYGDQIFKITTCLNANKDFDQSVAGCLLPAPFGSLP